MLGDVESLRHSPAFAARRLRSASLRRRASTRLAMAASIAFLLIAVPLITLLRPGPGGGETIEAVMLATDVGEVRQFALADGSRVTLDTKSAVRVQIGKGRREAVVEHGRARFSVVHSEVPLMIEVGRSAVSLDHGIVDVSKIDKTPRVELVAGTARIEPVKGASSQPMTLSAPVAIEEPGTTAQKVYPLSAQQVEWTSGRLSFTGARLGDVVASANRYTRAKIIVSDPRVASLRVTGVFRSGDAPGLAASLARLFGLKIIQMSGGNILLERAQP